MAFTQFHMHIGAHEKIGTIQYGVSSAGNTTFLNDETLSSAHADGDFDDGIIYFVSGNVKNDGQYRRIASYDASSGEFRFTTALTTLVTAGDVYGHATPEFNFTLMNQLAEAALRTLGPFVYSDRTMRSSANQRVYALTTNANRSKPFRIDVQTRTGSSVDNPGWTELGGWYIEPSTVGGAFNVIFPRFLPANRDIRIWYEDDHQLLAGSTSPIDSRIHPELAILALVEKMYEFRNSRARGAQDFDVQRWNDAKRQLAEARVRWPIWRPKRKPTIWALGDNDGYISGLRSNISPYGSLE